MKSLNLSLYWKQHTADKNCIYGICPELPDYFCFFYISKIDAETFWVWLPGLDSKNLTKRLILRDAKVARQFCIDYLNYNTQIIIENQISEMKRRSTNPAKTVAYYEGFLKDKVIGRVEAIPARFRKAS